MTWIMIGVIGGSLVVSGHDTKEACEGRAAVLRDQKVATKCVEAPRDWSYSTGGGALIIRPNGTGRVQEYRY